ncbi:MAG: hypothetical protein RL226_1425, partial [Bacteroidota bacterium]
TLQVDYTAQPELNTGGSSAISDAKGMYFINPDSSEVGKPTQVWTQGETEASSCWFPTIDTPNEKMTQEIFIRVRKDFTTLSNGTLVYSDYHDDGTKTDYWKQDKPHAPYLAMVAAGDFIVARDFWTRANGDQMQVDYYLEPEYAPYGFRIFGRTPAMLSFFSEILDFDYPWDKYSQIVVRDYVSGAMENTSAVIHGEFLNLTDRSLADYNHDDVIAHELFHHWFGDLVTCESWSNLALNESFATYSEYLWAEHHEGRDEADLHGYQSLQGYLEESRFKQLPLVRTDYADKEDMFDAHSYNKGGRVLHMLRSFIGDEAFFASLQLYLKQNAYKDAELDHFRLACEEVTGLDMTPFFEQWFFTPGHPELNITYLPNPATGEVQVSLLQLQDQPFRFPLLFNVTDDAGSRMLSFEVSEQEHLFNIPTSGKVHCITANPSGALLAVSREQKPQEWWRHQLQHGVFFNERFNAFTQLNADSADVAACEIALHDRFWFMRNSAIEKLFSATQWSPEIRDRIQHLANTDRKTQVAANAIRLLSERSPETLTESFLTTSFRTIRSIAIQQACLNALVEVAPNQAIALARQNTGDIQLQNAVAAVLGNLGNEQDLDAFKAMIRRNPSRSVLQSYTYYLSKLPVDPSVEAFAILMERAQGLGEQWWIKIGYYHAIGTLHRRIMAEQGLDEIARQSVHAAYAELCANESSEYLQNILNQYL